MNITTRSMNSSKNLLLNNQKDNSDSSPTYSHITAPEDNPLIEDLHNNKSFNYNPFNMSSPRENTPNISFNNNSLIINTHSIHNTTSNNNNNNNQNVLVNNKSFRMSNYSNNNSFSLNNNSTRNLLGNTTLNPVSTNMSPLHQNSFSYNNTPNSPNNLNPILTPTSPIANMNSNNTYSSNNSNNNNNSNINNNNTNTSSHTKMINTDIPVTTSMPNKGGSSPAVPPLAVGKDDSEYEEEKDNQIVIVIDPKTLVLPVNEVVETINDPAIIPNSVEDWIKYHAAIDPDRKFLPPDEPPSKIPILESMIPLDEVITPQRSVSCRIRLLQQQRRKKAQELAEQEKHIQHNNSKSMNNTMQTMNTTMNTVNTGNDAIIYSSPSIKMPSAVRSTKKYKHESANLRSNSNRYTVAAQIAPPKFQLCTYKKCDWIATNKCEKCRTLCCLDHSHRFYYFFPSLFSPKYYCPDCMRSVTIFWRWCYLVAGFVMLALLVICTVAHYSYEQLSSLSFTILCVFIILITVMAFCFSYLSNQYQEKTKESERLLLD